MQIHSISIKQTRKNEEQQIHIDRRYGWEQQHGKRAAELIRPIIRNYGKRAGVVELVMVPVDGPENFESVTRPVVGILQQIGRAED